MSACSLCVKVAVKDAVKDALSTYREPSGLGNSAAIANVRAYLRGSSVRSAFAVLDQMVVSGTSFVTTMIVGQFCGTAGLGLFALAMGALVFANGTLTSFVLTPYTVFRTRAGQQGGPADRAGDTLVRAVLLIGILTLASGLAAATVTIATPAADVVALAWALLITVPLFLGRDFARRFDFAHLNMSGALVVDLGVAAIQISLLLLLGLLGHLSSSAAIATIGVACALMTVCWASRRRHDFSVKRQAGIQGLRRDWQFGRWLFVDHLVCVLQLYLAYWLLTLLLDTSATGVFAACASIAALAHPLLHGIGNYLSPRFAATVAAGSWQDTMQLYWRTTILLAIAVSGFTGVAIWFGADLLWLFYRDATLVQHGAVMGLMAGRLLLSVPAVAAEHAVVATECPRGCVVATAAGLAATASCAVPLILAFGVVGAALSVLIGTAIEAVVMMVVFVHRLRMWEWKDVPAG